MGRRALMVTIPPSIIRAMNAIGFDPSSARHQEAEPMLWRPSVVLAAEDVVSAPRGLASQDVPVVPGIEQQRWGRRIRKKKEMGRADTLSEGDEDEDRDGQIDLLPLGQAVKAREPPS